MWVFILLLQLRFHCHWSTYYTWVQLGVGAVQSIGRSSKGDDSGLDSLGRSLSLKQ